MNRRQLTTATFALLLLPLLFGCRKQSGKLEPRGGDLNVSPAATATPSASPEPVAKPNLHVINEEQFAEILEEHRGEVVLVDFWATWCLECLELMPHTVELQKELGDEGLRVMLVSLDSPEDRRDTIEKLLSENGVTFDSYVSQYGGDPKSAEVFEIEAAALPNIKLYDRKGALRRVFSAGRMPPEPFGAEDIEKAVRELLAEE
jgi:thiol-disulfide isomerase/thioredoxin